MTKPNEIQTKTMPRIVTMSAAGFAMPAVSRPHEPFKADMPEMARKESARVSR